MRTMDRRGFLQQTTAGAVALTMPDFSGFAMNKFARNNAMGIVVHSYGSRWNSKVASQKYPGFVNAIDLLEHCHQLGASGIQVVMNGWTDDFAKKVRDKREQLGMYIEGSLGVPKTADDVPKFEQAIQQAKEAGVTVIRTVCSAGRRYETYHSPEAFQTLRKNALTSLQLAEPVLRKHKIKLAVENHKDWRADELVALIKEANSEWIGVTVDFGNSISLLEDPMTVVETLSPYVLSTHVKDMGVAPYAAGFLLSEVPLGTGVCDLPKMIALCRKHNPAVTFSLEMITRDPLEIPCLTNAYWETLADVPATDLARTLRMVNEHTYKPALPRTSSLSPEQKLAAEEDNILACMAYSKSKLGFT